MTKEEQIEQLAAYIVQAMYLDEAIVEEQRLIEYYNSPEGLEDFETNYAQMKEDLVFLSLNTP